MRALVESEVEAKCDRAVPRKLHQPCLVCKPVAQAMGHGRTAQQQQCRSIRRSALHALAALCNDLLIVRSCASTRARLRLADRAPHRVDHRLAGLAATGAVNEHDRGRQGRHSVAQPLKVLCGQPVGFAQVELFACPLVVGGGARGPLEWRLQVTAGL